MDRLEWIAPCHFGLEAVLKREIQDLGYEISQVEDGRVTFYGGIEAVCRANIFLRTAERILLKVGSFKAVSFDELFEKTKSLPWEDYSGGSGTEIGSLWFSNGYYGDLIGTAPGSVECYANYYWGLDFTKLIVEEAENNMLRDMDLNGKPRTAAGYCYAKNKRNADGSISNPKWYLPGIRELERILEDYYIEYPEFQANYYWSSAAGFDEIGIIISRQEENLRYARATKAHLIENEDGTTSFKYSESGDGYDYTGENGEGGRTPRKQLLRIRAARTDALPQN